MPKFPDAKELVPGPTLTAAQIYSKVCSQRRMCAYRALVFWCFREIRKGERRPLPSCIYALVRASYPGTENEEEFADMVFSEFEFVEVELD